MIPILSYKSKKKEILRRLESRLQVDDKYIKKVTAIIKGVSEKGDKALLDYSKRFDGVTFRKAAQLKISPEKLKKAWQATPVKLKKALKLAADRIRNFHKHQLPVDWTLIEKDGIKLTQRYLPLESVGVYVPGGLAAYPSSVLMNVIPAQIAGVKRIVMVTPPIKEKESLTILAAAYMLKIKEVYQVGGAQAVAALAFGTKTVPKVDKIVGPGSIWVAGAKRLLYGIIDIDMFAGPSEIMVIADSSADMSFVVADLLSQAEHDSEANSIVVFIGKVNEKKFLAELSKQVEAAPRKKIIRQSLKASGLAIRVPDRKTALSLINLKAPEHLELMVRNPLNIAKKVQNAGAIFLGPYTPEVIGDYVAGPNHTLPTAGTARFFSPLSVLDFVKGNHVVEFSKDALLEIGDAAIEIAESEQFFAHANSVKIRKDKLNQ
jgi:histidinol dehydrogenase